jgi:hypothetical protein
MAGLDLVGFARFGEKRHPIGVTSRAQEMALLLPNDQGPRGDWIAVWFIAVQAG